MKYFIRVFLFKHEKIGTSLYKLLELFIGEFGEVKIDYNNINPEEKNNIINKYRQKHNIINENKIKIEDI